MPDDKRKRELMRMRAMLKQARQRQLSPADSIAKKLKPVPTHKSLGRLGLYESGLITKGRYDSVRAEVSSELPWYIRPEYKDTPEGKAARKKGEYISTPQERKPTEREKARKRLSTGKGTAIDSVSLGLKKIPTPKLPKSREEQRMYWVQLRQRNRSSLGDIIDQDLEDEINEEVRKLKSTNQQLEIIPWKE